MDFNHNDFILPDVHSAELYHPNIDYACYFKSVTRSDSLQFQVRGDMATKIIRPDQTARPEKSVKS